MSGLCSRRAALPLFLTHKNKYVWGGLLFATGALLYLATNHFQIKTPRFLPLFWMDNEIPFRPEDVWIYTSEWAFLAFAYLRCRDLLRLNQYFYSYLTLQLVCAVIFVAWPTIYPRELDPLDSLKLSNWTHYVFDCLRQTDLATNCCPSLHVAGLYLTIRLFGKAQRWDFWFFLIWGTLIGVSTLTTKQHYMTDVLAGLAVSMIIHWIFRNRFAYRTLHAPGAQC